MNEIKELAQCQLKSWHKPSKLGVFFFGIKTTLLSWAYGCYGNFS